MIRGYIFSPQRTTRIMHICRVLPIRITGHPIPGMRLPARILGGMMHPTFSIVSIHKMSMRTTARTMKLTISKVDKSFPPAIGIAINWHSLLDIALWTWRLLAVKNTTGISVGITRLLRKSSSAAATETREGGRQHIAMTSYSYIAG